MTTLRLYGKKPRCWWCGKKIPGEPLNLHLEYGGEKFECIVCSPECEQKSIRTSRYVERFVPVFMIGIVVSLLLSFVPNFPVMMTGFILLGVTILICPFCTPQTTKMLGMKKSFMLGRFIGLAVLGISLFVLASRLTK